MNRNIIFTIAAALFLIGAFIFIYNPPRKADYPNLLETRLRDFEAKHEELKGEQEWQEIMNAGLWLAMMDRELLKRHARLRKLSSAVLMLAAILLAAVSIRGRNTAELAGAQDGESAGAPSPPVT